VLFVITGHETTTTTTAPPYGDPYGNPYGGKGYGPVHGYGPWLMPPWMFPYYGHGKEYSGGGYPYEGQGGSYDNEEQSSNYPVPPYGPKPPPKWASDVNSNMMMN